MPVFTHPTLTTHHTHTHPSGLIWPPVPLFRNSSVVEQPFNATDLTPRYTSEAIAFMQRFAGSEGGGGGEAGGAGDAGAAATTSIKTGEKERDIHKQEETQPQPFFLHVAWEAPHVPLFTAPEFQGTSRRGGYGDAVQEMDDSLEQVGGMGGGGQQFRRRLERQWHYTKR